jgi:hypothetical protein
MKTKYIEALGSEARPLDPASGSPAGVCGACAGTAGVCAIAAIRKARHFSILDVPRGDRRALFSRAASGARPPDARPGETGALVVGHAGAGPASLHLGKLTFKHRKPTCSTS